MELSYTDYHYYTDLAPGVSYTPPADSESTLLTELGQMEDGRIEVQFYDGAGWITTQTARVETMGTMFQDTAQSLRVTNGHATSDIKISLTGVTRS